MYRKSMNYVLGFVLMFSTGALLWAKADASVSHDKGFSWKTADGHYALKVNGLLQPWVLYQSVGVGTDVATFQLHRARVDLTGNVFTPKMLYRLNTEFAGIAGGTTATLLDAYLDWAASKHFQFRWGQFKAPFSREFLTSATSLQFVDRSIVTTAFGLGRDLGVVWHGFSWGERIAYDFFAVNGDGLNQTNLNRDFVLGGRFTWAIIGNPGFVYSDVGHSTSSQWSVGVGGAYDTGNAALTQDKLLRLTVDTLFFRQGFSVALEGHVVTNTTNNQTDIGYLAQTGYFFVPKTWEVAVRVGGVGRAATGAFKTGPVDSTEITGGLNYFFNEHLLKLQGDYGYLINNAATNNRNDHLVRLQLTAVI